MWESPVMLTTAMTIQPTHSITTLLTLLKEKEVMSKMIPLVLLKVVALNSLILQATNAPNKQHFTTKEQKKQDLQTSIL